jgi:hypothetical protein
MPTPHSKHWKVSSDAVRAGQQYDNCLAILAFALLAIVAFGTVNPQRGVACSICCHERRHQIELALVHRVPLRTIAVRFEVSLDAVHRHGRNHPSAAMRAALLSAQRPTEVDL